jgi:anti-anti-sigma factor
MDTTPQHLPSVTVVRAPSDELDLSCARSLRRVLDEAHRPSALVVLDLDGVTFLDSAALAVVLDAERRLGEVGGALVLVNVAVPVLRVLRICGLAERLVSRPDPLVPRPV